MKRQKLNKGEFLDVFDGAHAIALEHLVQRQRRFKEALDTDTSHVNKGYAEIIMPCKRTVF